MPYKLETVAYRDASGLSETMMRAMTQDEHYGLQFKRHVTTDELIADTGLRVAYNLSNNRSRLRHQKVIDTETGQIVGYGRWELPDTESSESAWPAAQMPAASEAQSKSFKDSFDSTMLDGKRKIFNYEMSEYLGPRLGEVFDELVEAGGPYLVLDYMVCHPDHQRRGVASMLLEQGEIHARQLGLKIFVMTATGQAGRRFYEKRGFKNLRTLTLDDSKWGGTTSHVTSFLEKEV